MSSLILVIEKFEGIIGALLGVVVTMLMNEYLKSKGKIRFYFQDFKLKYLEKNSEGGYEECEKEKDYTLVRYNFKVQLYNSSENRKILRDIKIVFVGNKGTIYNIVQNTDSRRVNFDRLISDDVNIINLNPKEIIEIGLEGQISKSSGDIKILRDIDKIYLIAKDSKDRSIKKIIKNYSKTS